MIEVESLIFRHKAAEWPILHEVSFSLDQGEIMALLGPNGSGKTTLFNCIAGHWQPKSGHIRLCGDDVLALSHRERARRLAVVQQDHGSTFSYSVREMVLMGRTSHVGPLGSPGTVDYAAVDEALAAVGIDGLSERDVMRVSGGELQMVLVARALAQESPIMLLDEPTSHLDLRNQLAVLKCIRETARQRGLTVVMTLHDPNLALMFADRVVLLKDGQVVGDGLPEAVVTESAIAAVYGVSADVVTVGGRRAVVPRMVF
jgi:iron complex transport system ATP-binding protein